MCHAPFPAEARGPIVIVGRPRSGTRMIARFCLDHDVFLGDDVIAGFLDSLSWYQRFVVPLVASPYLPALLGGGVERESMRIARQRLDDTWPRFRKDSRAVSVWGWKYPETLFVMPLIKRLFPSARFIHVLRDVRDVCLSHNGFFQLTGSHTDPPGWAPAPIDGVRARYVDFCTFVTFGRHRVSKWHSIDLRDRAAITRNRFLLQAQSWVTCVERARLHGQRMGSDYLEVRYEDICRRPGAVADLLLSFIGIGRSENTEASLARIRNRVGRWSRARMSLQEQRDLSRATELAAPLARQCGYTL